jgi:hypothetical protein
MLPGDHRFTFESKQLKPMDSLEDFFGSSKVVMTNQNIDRNSPT